MSEFLLTDIYIPLCFYYYAINDAMGGQMSRFTFHYVSITTGEAVRVVLVTEGFTFHYVSITTMSYLLFSCTVYFIYIPLCFYYYNF